MTSASTGLLKKGTQTPSPSSDLIAARNRPRDHSIKSEICLNGGVQPKQRQVCQSQIVSTQGFTPTHCVHFVSYRIKSHLISQAFSTFWMSHSCGLYFC
jgi:hypothetical protein